MDKYFSRRRGYEKLELQIESMNAKLKNRLWSEIYNLLYNKTFSKEYKKRIVTKLLVEFFGVKLSEIQHLYYPDQLLNKLEGHYDIIQWHKVYSLLEVIINIIGPTFVAEFTNSINKILLEENSGWRLSNSIFIPVINDEELEEINKATELGELVKEHLTKAKEFLSPGQKTDNYRNSIKESISAVEVMLRQIANNDKELSENVGVLKEYIHPALIKSLTNIYGYTSDTSGVRHALKENENTNIPDQSEAIFSLVVCSSYINFIESKIKNSKTKSD